MLQEKKLSTRLAEMAEEVRAAQSMWGVEELQWLIDCGDAWTKSEEISEMALDALQDGVCFLPNREWLDYHFNVVPTASDVEPETAGSIELAYEFWTSVDFIADGYVDYYRI